MSNLSAEQTQALKEFERGHRLAQLIRSEGWTELLNLMKEDVEKDEFRLLNLPVDAPHDLVEQVRIAARISRNKFETLVLRVDAAITAAIPEEFNDLYRDRNEYLS